MKTLIRRIARVSAAAAFFISMLLPRVALAHATAPTTASTTPTTSTAAAPDAYQFTAKKGDSLSRFARRALQLYQADNQVTLTPAAAVYGEATISQALGGTYVEIGQHVDIPNSLVASTIESSKGLSSAQLNRWAQYAANVSFEVSDVQVEKPAAVAAPSEGTTNTESTPATTESTTPDQTTTPVTDKKVPGTYWWFIGAGALIAIYFVLGGQSPRPSKR